MALLKFKQNVRVPRTVIIAVAFINSVNKLTIPLDQWVTSGNDGIHMGTSKHYVDAALDFRSKHMSKPDKAALIKDLKSRLGKNYDIILENEGGENEHIHIEYDPT